MVELEIYDCTPREGEQAAGASFSLDNRLKLYKKLDSLGVDYVELGWPVSEETLKAFKECKKIQGNAKIVAFGSTSITENVEDDENLKSIIDSGADYACIFGKTWVEHVEKQLNLTKEGNLEKIKKSVEFLKAKGLKVFYDAEHYFDGFLQDEDYAIECLKAAENAGAERLILCDTRGGMLPDEAEKIVKATKEKIGVPLGVHFHNDSGMALANTFSCLDYIEQVQGTINGLGERVGNLNFSEFLPNLILKKKEKLKINLSKLKEVVEEIYELSGIDMPCNLAFVGRNAFAHKGGVHIDATSKGASYEHISPEEVGNKRIMVLNTLGGRKGVIESAKELGYNLDKKDEKVKEKIAELFEELRSYENDGYNIGALKAEQFLLIEKYFGELKEFFEIEKWNVATEKEGENEESIFYVKGKINGENFKESLLVDGGPVDAAYKVFKKVLAEKYPEVEKLNLVDFHVSLARCKKEESTVRTSIKFEDGEEFEVVGVDKNILASSIEALEKGFRYYLNRFKNKQNI